MTRQVITTSNPIQSIRSIRVSQNRSSPRVENRAVQQSSCFTFSDNQVLIYQFPKVWRLEAVLRFLRRLPRCPRRRFGWISLGDWFKSVLTPEEILRCAGFSGFPNQSSWLRRISSRLPSTGPSRHQLHHFNPL